MFPAKWMTAENLKRFIGGQIEANYIGYTLRGKISNIIDTNHGVEIQFIWLMKRIDFLDKPKKWKTIKTETIEIWIDNLSPIKPLIFNNNMEPDILIFDEIITKLHIRWIFIAPHCGEINPPV